MADGEQVNFSGEQARQPRVIVDIGGGQFPWAADPDRRQLQEGDEVIVVDLFSTMADDKLESARSLMGAIGRGLGRRLRLERGDASQLPLDDESADGVTAVNLFGDKLITGKRATIAAEAVRILRPEGTITVVETYSPSMMPIETLRELFASLGLTQINRDKERDIESIRGYSDPRSDGTHYIAIFAFSPPGGGDEHLPDTSPTHPPAYHPLPSCSGGSQDASIGAVCADIGEVFGELDKTRGLAELVVATVLKAQQGMVATLHGSDGVVGVEGTIWQAIERLARYDTALTAARRQVELYAAAIGGVLK